MSKEKRERVVVTVNDKEFPIDSVAASLRARGMKVGQDEVMPAIGIITGEIAPSKIPAIESVPGVVAVEPEQPMQAL